MKTSPPLPSDRKFGFFMCFVFSGLASYFLWHGLFAVCLAVAIIAVLLGFFAWFLPARLSKLNLLWSQLGLLLGRVVSPIVLGSMFFLLITPVALFSRLLGRDALKLKKCAVESYWISRDPPGPSGDSFNNQF